MPLVVSLLFGVIAMTGSTAQAQNWRRFDGHRGRAGRAFIYPRQWYWQDRWYWNGSPYSFGYPGYFPSSHLTEGQGYRDGLDDGKDDAKHGKAFDRYRHKDYKNVITSAYINAYLRAYGEG